VTGDILDTIDSTLRDFTVGKDAMRWCPEPPAGLPAPEANCSWLAVAGQASGQLDIYPPATVPFLAVETGDLITFGGTPYRVTGKQPNANGSITFDVEPAPHD